MYYNQAGFLPTRAEIISLWESPSGERSSDSLLLYQLGAQKIVRRWVGGEKIQIDRPPIGNSVARLKLDELGNLIYHGDNADYLMNLLGEERTFELEVNWGEKTGRKPAAGHSWDGESYVNHPKEVDTKTSLRYYRGSSKGRKVTLDLETSALVRSLEPVSHRQDRSDPEHPFWVFVGRTRKEYFACDSGGKFLWRKRVEEGDAAVVDGGLILVERKKGARPIFFRPWSGDYRFILWHIPADAKVEIISPGRENHFSLAYSDSGSRVGQKSLTIVSSAKSLKSPLQAAALWKLELYLRDFYFKPGGPGFFAAIRQD